MLLNQTKTLFKQGRILFFCLVFIACTKEKTIKDAIQIDDKIFCTALISNDTTKGVSGLRIYGYQLLNKGIRAVLNHKNTSYPLNLIYHEKDDQNHYYECDLSDFHFKENEQATLKVYYDFKQDSITLDARLPQIPVLNDSIKYISGNYEYSLNGNIQSSETLIFESQFNESISSIKSSNYNFKYEELPFGTYYNPSNSQSIFSKTSNANDLKNGFSVYNAALKNISTGCNQLALPYYVSNTYMVFDQSDYTFIEQLKENFNNIGNPFFIFYQAKGVKNSNKGYIYGNILELQQYKKTIRIKDPSSALIHLKILDKSGIDITLDKQYSFTLIDQSNKRQRIDLRNDSLILTFNRLKSTYLCDEKKIAEKLNTNNQYKISATKTGNLQSLESNYQTVDLNQFQNLTFQLK